MTKHNHWANCITHRNSAASEFIEDYFKDTSRRCLIVGGAGFDPRSCIIAKQVAAVMDTRLKALLIREGRPDPNPKLMRAANENEATLRAAIKDCDVRHIDIIAHDDRASIGGSNIIKTLWSYTQQTDWLGDLTDIILDMSALSIGISFPLARYFLHFLKDHPHINFHIMASQNPALDNKILSEPHRFVQNAYGFPSSKRRGKSENGIDLEEAIIWLPQLASNKEKVLNTIKGQLSSASVCPVVPFPAEDPREADKLIAEYVDFLGGIDTRDLMYVSEHNPLDSYRRISELKTRFDEANHQYFSPQIVLSPMGSKVMTIGALMAALKHDLHVTFVEALRYEIDLDNVDASSTNGEPNSADVELAKAENVFHVWLEGPIYAGYGTSLK